MLGQGGAPFRLGPRRAVASRTGADLCGGPTRLDGLEFFRSPCLPISCPRREGLSGKRF